MNLPYVIDNREHTLADLLNHALRSEAVHALDVATAYPKAHRPFLPSAVLPPQLDK